MNRLTLLLILLVTSPFFTCAQGAWPSENSEWYFDHENCFSPSILTHFEVTGTTEIEGIECTVLHQSTYSSWGDPLESDYYLYYNGDTLFWLFEDTFYPLLCFNLEAGDTWNPLPTEHPGLDPNCAFSGMKVTDAYTVEIDGESYRQIEIAPEVPQPEEWEDPWPSIMWGGTFNERTFGYGQFFPLYNMCDAVVEWECYGFRCYNDEQVSIEETNGETCDHPLTVSIDEYTANSRPLIFPNPLQNGSTLQMSSELDVQSITVFSVIGQRVVEESIGTPKNFITLNLNPGQYLVHIALINGEEGWEKLVIVP